MIPDINQNFSLPQGSDLIVEYDIGPDTTGLNLEFADILVRFWTQSFGVPNTDQPTVLEKSVGAGIEVTDPLLLKFSMTMQSEDTIDLDPGNYFYKVQITADQGRITYPTYGFMTVLRSD